MATATPLQSKPNRKAVNRSKILAAAALEFGKDGVKGAKVDAIVASSGLTKRTLYKYFDNKEDMFSAILEEFLAAMDAIAAISYDADRDFDEQLGELIATFVNANTNEEYLSRARVITCEFLKGRQITPEQFRRYEAWEKKLSQWMEQAMADGQITSSFSGLEVAAQFYQQVKAETFFPLLFGIKANTDANRQESITKLTRQFKEFYRNSRV